MRRLAGPTACVVKKQTTDDTPIVMYFLMGLSLSLHSVPYAAQC